MHEIPTKAAELASKIQEVEQLLSKGAISFEEWGKKTPKTVAHLAKEQLKGESVLVFENGELFRKADVVKLDVRYRGGEQELMLVEAKQVYHDSDIPGRGPRAGMSEKIVRNEDPLTAAKRALQEELGIISGYEISAFEATREVRISDSFPGLKTDSLIHRAQVVLSEEVFVPEGYVENQADKNVYFVWEPVLVS